MRSDDVEELVARAMRRYGWALNQGALEWDDLKQVGRVGAHEAEQSFKSGMGMSLRTYTKLCIKRRMLREAQRHGKTVRIPAAASYEAWRSGCALKSGRVSTGSVEALNGGVTTCVLERNGFVTEPHEAVADMAWHSESLNAGMSALPAREAEILRMRFAEDMALEAIGGEMGLSRERVRQLQERALKRLREAVSGTVQKSDEHERVSKSRVPRVCRQRQDAHGDRASTGARAATTQAGAEGGE